MAIRNDEFEPVGTALFNLDARALQPLVRAVVAEVMAEVERRRKADSEGGVLPIKPLLLTPRQAAGALGISTRTLWELTQRSEIPTVEPVPGEKRHHVRYDPVDLVAWIQSKKTSAKRAPHDGDSAGSNEPAVGA
jgi:Helix-turn-helix domain